MGLQDGCHVLWDQPRVSTMAMEHTCACFHCPLPAELRNPACVCMHEGLQV